MTEKTRIQRMPLEASNGVRKHIDAIRDYGPTNLFIWVVGGLSAVAGIVFLAAEIILPVIR